MHLSECSLWRLSLAGRGGARCSRSPVVGAGPCRGPLPVYDQVRPHFVRMLGALATLRAGCYCHRKGWRGICISHALWYIARPFAPGDVNEGEA